ncbi:unnamed protein product [Ranitomeya imitator]|uniref:Leucine-rich repeat and calponin homology domain-containing protein 3 n=1 Tax=Ranitomeya imitator TaxID=111125 RepID=A0ABN9MIA4_9NEOB|nr:unnamed protein product [Ranitomeya imitator]
MSDHRDHDNWSGRDLSRNRLSEIPAEICNYVSLESLNLYQNCVRYVPEATLNLQALTFLNLSRNQLTSLPGHVCSLPLKVLIASNNKLDSLPGEISHLRLLTELDVSCNEIQTLPQQIGKLESLRDLNIRRNHLVRLPEELAELPLVRLDFSCNKVTSIPACFRNLRHLQSIILDNNPLQSPPAQICIKGKIHIFKYLNIEALKNAPDLPEFDRRPLGFSTCHDDVYPGRTYGALDSGFNSVDSGDKRWSGNEPTDEFTDLSFRTTDANKEQRLRRDHQNQDSRGSSLIANGGVENDLDQIDYIDSYATEEEEEEARLSRGDSLSSQFMAYIEERRVTHESSPFKQAQAREQQRSEEARGHLFHSRGSRHHVDATYLLSLANGPNQTKLDRHRRDILENTRREAQLAARQYEDERIRDRIAHTDSLKHPQRLFCFFFGKYKNKYITVPSKSVRQQKTLSPEKQSPLDSENVILMCKVQGLKRAPNSNIERIRGSKVQILKELVLQNTVIACRNVGYMAARCICATQTFKGNPSPGFPNINYRHHFY